MNDTTAKQQIVERIKKATNILVTLGKNPNVDELSAALGLTLMLNKLDKHVTAVFSGAIPPAIEFLEPSKTFENTVDSLRDFIIALDKEKADRLRYRVEDDMVRIFITPYRTKITQEDLKFTHGDFNVELVLALGVEKQADLDDAISAHGKILHDATVATLTNGSKKSSLGSIDWQDSGASSLCEMLVAISESLQSGLLDEQTSTALLTGIVAATDRFSNNQTSPKSMTMAAQLMAAGANQQLIAAKLEESSEISTPPPEQKPGPVENDGSTRLNEGDSKKIQSQENEKEKPSETEVPESEGKKASDGLGEITIDHQASSPDQLSVPPPEFTTPAPQEPIKPPYVPSATIEEHDKRNKRVAGEQALDEALAEINGGGAPIPESDIQAELATISPTSLETEPTLSYIETGDEDKRLNPEELSSTELLGDTPQDDEDDPTRKEEIARNKTIMNHGSTGSAAEKKVESPGTQADHASTLSEIESQLKTQNQPTTSADHPDSVRQEINSIFDTNQALPPTESTQSLPEITQAPSLLPPPPPLPDFSNLPPLPPSMSPPADSGQTSPQSQAPPVPAVSPDPNDPGQFHIPGQ